MMILSNSRSILYTCEMQLLQPNGGDGFQDEQIDLLPHRGIKLDLVLHMPHMLLVLHELELVGHNSHVIELMQHLLLCL